MNVTCSIIAWRARFRFVWLIATMLSASGNATLMEHSGTPVDELQKLRDELDQVRNALAQEQRKRRAI